MHVIWTGLFAQLKHLLDTVTLMMTVVTVVKRSLIYPYIIQCVMESRQGIIPDFEQMYTIVLNWLRDDSFHVLVNLQI